MADTDELAKGLQALPAEIFNDIFALTIKVDNHVVIDHTYKPPVGLQLFRKTRQAFAHDYYTNTNFSINITKRQDLIRSWLAALPVAHVNLLQTVNMNVLHASGMDSLTVNSLTMRVHDEYDTTRELLLGRPGVERANFMKIYYVSDVGDKWLSAASQYRLGTA